MLLVPRRLSKHCFLNKILEGCFRMVDRFMNWGTQYDDVEDLALPTGMAASIALEESCAFGS